MTLEWARLGGYVLCNRYSMLFNEYHLIIISSFMETRAQGVFIIDVSSTSSKIMSLCDSTPIRTIHSAFEKAIIDPYCRTVYLSNLYMISCNLYTISIIEWTYSIFHDTFFFCMGLGLRSWQCFSGLLMPKRSQQKVVHRKCVGASLSRSFHFFSRSTDGTSLRVLALRTESWSVPQHVQHFPPHSWWAKSGREKQWCRIQKNRETWRNKPNFGYKWRNSNGIFIGFWRSWKMLPKNGWKQLRGNHHRTRRMSHWMFPASPFSKAQGSQWTSFRTGCCCGMIICPNTHIWNRKSPIWKTLENCQVWEPVSRAWKRRGEDRNMVLSYHTQWGLCSHIIIESSGISNVQSCSGAIAVPFYNSNFCLTQCFVGSVLVQYQWSYQRTQVANKPWHSWSGPCRAISTVDHSRILFESMQFFFSKDKSY